MLPLILLLALGQTPEPTPPTFGALIITASNDYAAYQDALAKSGSADAEVTAATSRATTAKATLEAKKAKLKVTMDMLNNLSPAKPSLPTVKESLTVPKPQLPPASQATTDVAPAPPIPRPELSEIYIATATWCTYCAQEQAVLSSLEAKGYKVHRADVSSGQSNSIDINGSAMPFKTLPQLWIVKDHGSTIRTLNAGFHDKADLEAELR